MLAPADTAANRVIMYSACTGRTEKWRVMRISNPPPAVIANEFCEGSGVHAPPLQPDTVTALACTPPNRACANGVKRVELRNDSRGPPRYV